MTGQVDIGATRNEVIAIPRTLTLADFVTNTTTGQQGATAMRTVMVAGESILTPEKYQKILFGLVAYSSTVTDDPATLAWMAPKHQ